MNKRHLLLKSRGFCGWLSTRWHGGWAHVRWKQETLNLRRNLGKADGEPASVRHLTDVLVLSFIV